MRYGTFALVLIICCCSCSNSEDNDRKKAPAKLFSPKEKFDFFEHIVGNDNWLLVKGEDSSYLYFSRLGERSFKTYQYRMRNGDSTGTIATDINLSGDSITWHFPQTQQPLYLFSIDLKKAVWNDSRGSSYTLQKLDSDNILLKYPGQDGLVITRTMTLSAFLVKSKYDCKNGTRLAFENMKRIK